MIRSFQQEMSTLARTFGATGRNLRPGFDVIPTKTPVC
ncbi:hypothetical protein FRUB_02739 [Fimbriiglobus ruber]|uniref:Uncharacterized protein n=1 Tax=Fimbriiglobus ruber TaxID=1908690 RepID=A0A225DNV0_9BACT|nr:hypothetical protein FRUB_02739 [Fimbriiglobus ruber]